MVNDSVMRWIQLSIMALIVLIVVFVVSLITNNGSIDDIFKNFDPRLLGLLAVTTLLLGYWLTDDGANEGIKQAMEQYICISEEEIKIKDKYKTIPIQDGSDFLKKYNSENVEKEIIQRRENLILNYETSKSQYKETDARYKYFDRKIEKAKIKVITPFYKNISMMDLNIISKINKAFVPDAKVVGFKTKKHIKKKSLKSSVILKLAIANLSTILPFLLFQGDWFLAVGLTVLNVAVLLVGWLMAIHTAKETHIKVYYESLKDKEKIIDMILAKIEKKDI